MSWSRADRSSDSKARAPISITTRLAVLYAVSAYVMLVATTAFLYVILVSGIERADFYFVLDKVHRLEWALRHDPDAPGLLHKEINWNTGRHDPEHDHTFYSRILDDRGRTRVETAGMADVISAVQFPSPVRLERMSRPEVVQRWRSPDGRSYCVLSVRVGGANNAPSSVIQVAMDDAEEEATINTVQRASLVALLLGTLFSAGLGSIVARRGMKPLREIAVSAERITASQLNERIDPASQPEELAALATALNRMLGRLEDSFVRTSRFAADVAHELRTPIHNLMAEADVALSSDHKPEEYRGVLESIMEEFERLLRMINEMLFLARAESPQSHIVRKRLDARREIDAVREFFDALIESRGVTVTSEGRAEIDADPLLFRRALTNLLSNALRHTPRGGKIVLSVDQTDDGMVLVEVADSGRGILPERLPRVCDRLYSADLADAQVAEHTGLGLSIVKSIVALHGGSIAINSAPGKGTTVLMRFHAPTPAVPA